MASSKFFIACLCLFVFLFPLTVFASTYYVDDDGPNDPGPYDPNVSDPLMDGSVNHPFDNIQEGIDVADTNNIDTVLVLPGTYYENINFNGKNIVLTSTDSENPDIVASTIIDGGQNSSVVTFSGGENTSCQLRGLTITNGYNSSGGGIYGAGTKATIENCTITGNTCVASGGGLNECDGLITNCTISGNTSSHWGGGLYECDGLIDNCTIISNTSEQGGGGLSVCDAIIVGCTITENASYYGGGGLYFCGGTITNCTISSNSCESGYGGGLDACDGSITNCTITRNTSGYRGGGLGYCDGTITNCTISGNTADGGGGLYFCGGTITNCTISGNEAWSSSGGLCYCDGPIVNCIVWSNTAPVYPNINTSSTPTYSCIQGWTGGGTGNITSDPMFTDTSSGDPAEWDLHLLGASPCIDAGTNSPSGGLPGTDIEGNPRPFDGDGDGTAIADMGACELSFVDPNLPYIYLHPSSLYFLAYEAGNNPDNQTMNIRNFGSQELNWLLDLDGKPDWLTITPTSGSLDSNESDPVTLSVDITGLSKGQYHYTFDVVDPAAVNSPQTMNIYLGIGVIYVPGTYSTIQAATDAALDGDMIIVSLGTYVENINFNGKDIILTSTDPTDPNSMVINEGTVSFSGTETSACRLSGFTITQGAGIRGYGTKAIIENCTITDNWHSSDGGGLYDCDGAITNCTITDNTADWVYGDYYCHGGGLYDCDGAITNCTITDNAAYGYGGGLYKCDGTITNCTISGNEAWESGGGLYDCNGAITNCEIIDNLSDYHGGGLCGCDGTITNCIIADNTASVYGGGLFACHGPITNSTIVNNWADARITGGGIDSCDGPITNCIAWGNRGWIYNSSVPTYSCTQYVTGGGIGNISSDPLFADAENGDYHLKSKYGRWDSNEQIINDNGTPTDANDDFWEVISPRQWMHDDLTSPCIDAGKPEIMLSYWDPNGTPTDPNDDFYVEYPDPNGLWTNELWPHGGRINMGAYGGTAQASMSPNPVGNVADLDHDDAVNLVDLELFSEDWLYEQVLLDTDLNRNGKVDMTDLAQFCAQWLWQQE